MKKLLYLFAFVSCALISCEKEPFISVSVTNIQAPADGNSTTIIINSNNPWTISGADWCTVSPSSGDTGEVSVIVSVKENTTYDVRNCNLTFSSAGLSQIVSVKQDVNLGVVLQKSTYEISSDAQQITVEVKANVAYDISIDSEWIKQVETKALTSTTYTFSVEANETYDAREGSITIKEKNSENTEIIKVKQSQKDAIIISAKEYNLTSDAQTLDVKLQTNVDLEVIIPDSSRDWISYVETKSLASKILKFDIKLNDDYNDRNCSVIVKKKNSDYSEKVKITQAQKDAIIISTKEFELSSASHTLEVKLQTNVEMEVIVPDDAKNWITFVSTKALADKILLFSVKANETYNERIAEIYVKSKSISVQDTIRIKQTQNDAVIIPTKEYNIKSEAQTLEIKLQTNIDFEVIIPDNAKNWVSYVKTKSLSDRTVVLNIEANNGYNSRICDIIIRGKEILADTITVQQGGLSRIIYSTTDGKVVNCNLDKFNVKVVSNTYKDGVGVIDFSGELTAIGDKAFLDCSNLARIEIPNSVSTIGKYAFAYCYGLRQINLPEDLTSISDGLFYRCDGLEKVFIPEKVKNIGNNAFYSCDMLADIDIPESIVSIGYRAFSGCMSLKKIDLPNNITSLENEVFRSCMYLSNVNIPKSVKSIGKGVFNYCTSLESVVIPEGVTSLTDSVFANCSSLKYVVIPNSVTSIGNYTFSGCASLTDVDIRDNLLSIGKYAFENCSSLSEITWPSGIATIEDGVFLGCTNMQSLVIPESVTSIKGNAFCGSGLKSIIIPESIDVIEEFAFNGCINLTGITLPKNLKTIKKSAFYQCHKLKVITIPENVDVIEKEAFRDCSSLEKIVLPKNMKSIGAYAFYDCPELKEITFPEGITTLETGLFEGCSSLKDIVIPRSVQNIAANSLSGCFRLANVVSKAVKAPVLGQNAFYKLFGSGTRILKIPQGTKSEYENSSWKDYFSTIEEFE